ncbi:MAG: sulfite oxidase [Bacteroidota bacterium]
MKVRNTDRRTFLRQATTIGAVLGIGLPVVYMDRLPPGIPLLGLDPTRGLPGKHPDLRVLNDRPINAETPAHLLDEAITSADRLFVRNNGIPPAAATIKPKEWVLTIGGEAMSREVRFTLPELKAKFREVSLQLTLECGGNGRKEFNPPAKGNQWSTGAVGCPRWTGVRLREVLEAVGYNRSTAKYIGYYGADTHLSGAPDKVVISRGVPMAKALEAESLIAWGMNGEDLPLLNGYPLRLVFGGYPASASGKWLQRIDIRNQVHDGPKMGGQSYRVPRNPVPPGAKVADADMRIIEEMPVKSLITAPKTGATLRLGSELPISGHAWCGSGVVKKVDYSIDFGSTWRTCQLDKPVNRFAWQHFRAQIEFPQAGYYEVWARATDHAGRAQPMLLPGWNPKGYLNNACHRIAVKIQQ